MSLSSATLTSDYLEYRSSESVVVARGQAVLSSSATHLLADQLTLDLERRTARAEGRVSVQDGGLTVLAEGVDFDWAASTGVFTNGYFEDPPYRLWARKIVRVSSEMYHMEHAAVTSCTEDPPHYHVRMASLDYWPGKRAKAVWPRFAVGDATVFGLPYYGKRFRKKPWTLTVDPGHSTYQGYYAKSILSYRLTEHGTARAYWDHFTKTGEGFGAEYTYGAPHARGTLYGYRIEDRVAGTRRWNARAAHWQRLSSRLSLELNGLAMSDAGFNNLFFHDDLYRVRTEAQSSAAMTYQDPLYTARLSGTETRVFDPFRGKFVRQRTVAPELSLQGAPWKVARDTYFTAALAARNQYDRPSLAPPAFDPLDPSKDRFRWTGDGSMDLRRTVALGKKLSLEPSVGASGAWQSWRDPGAGLPRDPHDFVQGRGFTRVNLRHRLTRSLNYDFSHFYQVRWSPNQVKRDHSNPSDQGLESNNLSWIGSYRGRTLSGRLSTGYDLRDPFGQPVLSPRQKVTPPALDLSWRPVRWTSVSFREVYGLFPARHPQSAQFSWRLGASAERQFSSGFSYNGGLPGELQLRHGVSFAPTKGWRVEAQARYVVQGSGGLRYNAVPKERFEQDYVLRRDLHCWNARVTFRKRPGFTEAFFRLDLKSQSEARRELSSPEEKQYYPGRDVEGR